MAETEAPQEEAPKKKSKLPLILGVVAFLALGGGGFFAVYSGMILAPAEEHAEGEHVEGADPLPDIAFVPLEALTISIGTADDQRHLRFASQLEVASTLVEDVTLLQPRILDVLNGYLRAVDREDLEDPAALVRIRAQLLRRIQIVTGEGRVRDLLITEFVLN